jgi:WD40 repeat protein
LRAQTADDAKAEAEYKRLRERFDDSKADRERLRLDLLALRRNYPGTSGFLQAADLLRELPSPLDKLNADKIPELEKFTWQPKELVAVLGEHRGRQGTIVTGLTFSPDGKEVVSNCGPYVRFWDPKTLRQRSLLGFPAGAPVIMYTTDGKYLVAGCNDGTVRLWNMTKDKPEMELELKGATSPLQAVAFSPDGKNVAAGGDDTFIRLWDRTEANAKPSTPLAGHTSTVRGLAFITKTVLASGGYDGTVRLWDISGEKAAEITSVKANKKEVTALVYDHDNKLLAAGGNDGSVHIYSMQEPTKLKERTEFSGQDGWVSALAFSPGGKSLAVAGQERSVRIYDVRGKEPRELNRWETHATYLTSVAFSPDGNTLVTGGYDWTVRLWDLTVKPKPKEKIPPRGPLSAAYGATFSPDGTTLAVGSEDHSLRLWDVGKAEPKETRNLVNKEASAIYSVSYAPDGKTLAASGAQAYIWLWSPATGQLQARLEGFSAAVHQLQYDHHGREFLCAAGKELFLCDAHTGKIHRRFEGQTTSPNFALSADGSRIFSGSGGYETKDGKLVIKNGMYVYTDCKTRLFETATAKLLWSAADFTLPVTSVAFTPDGKTALAQCQDGSLRRWDVGKDEPAEGEKKQGFYRLLTVSPDGRKMAVLSNLGLEIWDLPGGKKLHTWALAEDTRCLAFASDSRHLAIGLATGPVLIVRLASPVRAEP